MTAAAAAELVLDLKDYFKDRPVKLLIALLLALATATPPPPRELPADARQRVLAVAASQIGVTERTGKNDGPAVEAYLASVKLARGNPYCAAYVYWCGREALGSLNPLPKSGWSPDFLPKGQRVTEPQPGDVFGIHFPEKGRIGHTGFVAPGGSRRFIKTYEANTSPDAAQGTAADRDAARGGGVFSKLRPKGSKLIYAKWLP